MSKRRPKSLLRRHILIALAASMVVSPILWGSAAYAGSLSGASVQLSDTRPAQTGVSYTFNFTVSGSTALQSFRAQMCTTPSGTCTTPSGFSGAAATLASQPTGYGSSSGWTNDSVTGSLQIMNGSNAIAPAGSQQIVLGNITNPSDPGNYFLRLTTYSDDTYTSSVDNGNTVAVIIPAITVTATVDPTLNFSVGGIPAATVYKGGLATSDRCVDTSTTITFGTPLLPLAPDTDYDCGQTLTTSTNADGGYQVTVHTVDPGNALKNGAASIPDWTGTNSSPTATPGGTAEMFAYTTNDASLSGTGSRFTASDNLFAGLGNTSEEVAYNGGSIAGDVVNVAFRLRFTPLSTAGTYTGKVVYTCTSTF